MNNSFGRIIDGMCATLRSEVLTRLDDEFARGQVFGVINLLNTFKARADWSAGFLLEQVAAQRDAIEAVSALLRERQSPIAPPALSVPVVPVVPPIDDLLALRDQGNRTIVTLLKWLDREKERMPAEVAEGVEKLLRAAMRAEAAIELRNAPRPMFAEISSGRE